MNEDDGPELCKKHNITGFPTMLVLENGKKVNDYNGERNKNGILDFINSL
jgi:thioredoxin-like negative regulator of GroEL